MFGIRMPQISQRMRISLLMLFMAIVLAVVYVVTGDKTATDTASSTAQNNGETPVREKINPANIIDFETVTDGETADMMAERKEKYGIENGVDMVVTSDESVKIGDNTLSMKAFEEENALRKGEIVTSDLAGNAATGEIREYGIHVVRSGDNLWNIHFRLLKEYFASRNVTLSPYADEPVNKGTSSGVGRLLKFSEQMVRIYNMKEQTFSEDLHHINPLEKVVIYNMTEVTDLLNTIDYNTVGQIRFDGKRLWIPGM